MKALQVDMESPKLWKTLTLYCIPLMISNVVQSIFNSVDMIMVNAFDPSSVAAIGATSSILHLLVHTFFGIATGVSVVLAQQIGAKNDEKIRQTVSTAILMGTLLGAVIAFLGVLLSPMLLRVTNCPSDIVESATLYLRIYLISVPAMMLYNFASVILTASGDTQRPMMYIIIAGLTNVVLNFVLLLILPRKIMAVAIATAVSQTVSAVMVLCRLICMKGACRLHLRRLQWSFSACGKILVNGVPAAITNALYPLSNLQVQSQINLLGSAVVAGNAAGGTIETFASVIYGCYGSAAAVFVGYNLGANRKERIKKTIGVCVAVNTVVTVLITTLTLLFARPLASLYVTEELAIQAALVRIRNNVTFCLINAIGSVFGAAIRAFGYSFMSTVNSVLSIFVFRIFWMLLIYPPHRDLSAPLESLKWIAYCWPISWIMTLTINLGVFIYLYFGRLKKGTLKSLV